MKRVLFVVIDALASRIIGPAMERGELPTFSALASRGVCRTESVAIFPSITPAATAALATGGYPEATGISGAFWYEEDRDCVAYYGDDVWVIIHRGLGNYFRDFLVELNERRLRMAPAFEVAERRGLTSAVINFMWFRGLTPHPVHPPALLRAMPGTEFPAQVTGPPILFLGDFVNSPALPGGEALTASGGMFRRYGFHDETTAEYLQKLADAGPLPDFTVAYFPNNDFDSHQRGPAESLDVVQRVDQALGELLHSRGGIDEFLADCAVIITGDHGQSDLLPDRAEQEIHLEELLDGFEPGTTGKAWEPGEEILCCPNMRSAQIYLRRDLAVPRGRELVERLLEHPRVDQVITRDMRGEERAVYCVESRERGRLEFSRAAAGTADAIHDVYGNHWTHRGELRVVDAHIDSDRGLGYATYPNALERIATGFSAESASLWVTARLGSEFRVEETALHRRGSHGSLHRDDSTSPLIVAGAPDGIAVPEHPRSVDVAPLALQILGIPEQKTTPTRPQPQGD